MSQSIFWVCIKRTSFTPNIYIYIYIYIHIYAMYLRTKPLSLKVHPFPRTWSIFYHPTFLKLLTVSFVLIVNNRQGGKTTTTTIKKKKKIRARGERRGKTEGSRGIIWFVWCDILVSQNRSVTFHFNFNANILVFFFLTIFN